MRRDVGMSVHSVGFLNGLSATGVCPLFRVLLDGSMLLEERCSAGRRRRLISSLWVIEEFNCDKRQ